MELWKKGTGLKGKLQILQVEREWGIWITMYWSNVRSGELKSSLKQEEREESRSAFAGFYVKYWEIVILAIFFLPHHAHLTRAKSCVALHTYYVPNLLLV